MALTPSLIRLLHWPTGYNYWIFQDAGGTQRQIEALLWWTGQEQLEETCINSAKEANSAPKSNFSTSRPNSKANICRHRCKQTRNLASWQIHYVIRQWTRYWNRKTATKPSTPSTLWKLCHFLIFVRTQKARGGGEGWCSVCRWH